LLEGRKRNKSLKKSQEDKKEPRKREGRERKEVWSHGIIGD